MSRPTFSTARVVALTALALVGFAANSVLCRLALRTAAGGGFGEDEPLGASVLQNAGISPTTSASAGKPSIRSGPMGELRAPNVK